MKAFVTGCAGFIGSHLAERLCRRDYQVIGVDCFSDYYSAEIKERNIRELSKHKNFIKLIRENILNLDLDEELRHIDVVFHQAAQAGVRYSWNKFKQYSDDNIRATQILLDRSVYANIRKFVFASSSSLYGDIDNIPAREDGVLNPISPYGITKLASEKLCFAYWRNFNLPVVSLRYFTVYGPRQRPDMAFSKFIKATLEGGQIEVYGDGNQTRDFTYIDDIVEANLAAAGLEENGKAFNLGGGSRISINEILKLISQISNKKLNIKYIEEQPGDVRHTWADTEKAKKYLNYNPSVRIEEGLELQYKWARQNQDVI